MRVAVLMSTYNGEKYLGEQIDSLLRQTDVELDIYIRDDGSTDRTPDILNEYAKNNYNIHVTAEKNIGLGNSFMSLVFNVPADFDYYAFSDQDDIWLENKLIKAIELIKENDTPTLYCSNQRLVDASVREYGVRFDELPDLSTEKILAQNKATGCTMVWNKALQEILRTKRPSEQLLKNRIHDVWVAMVASLCGEIIYDETGYILYRQHENNVVGAKDSTGLDVLKWKIKKLKNKDLRNGRSLLAEEAVRLFPTESQRSRLLSLSANSKSLKGKIEILKNSHDFISYSGERKLDFVGKVMCGVF